MKTLNVLLSFIVVAMVSSAHSEKMDLSTHTLVIDKLERVLGQMKGESHLKRTPINLRLADLYAERARLVAMQEIEKNCDKCDGSKKDRHRALALYQEVFENSKGDVQAKVLLQMAHLYEVLGNTDKAIALYRQVIRAGTRHYSREIIGQSYAGLGEIYFHRGNFRSALANYGRALDIRETPKRGFIMYRAAWCELNLGKLTRAKNRLTSVLTDPELLTIQTPQGPRIDQAFHEDVSRDLATFYARGEVGQAEINNLVQLSPESVRRNNLFFLGTETDRLGKKSSSLVVWSAFLEEGKATHMEKLEIQIRVAKLHFDLGRPQRSLEEMQKAVDLWKKGGCTDATDCQMLKSRLRKHVIEWNRGQKKKPTRELFAAYTIYSSLFTDDIEMHFWAGGVARDLKMYPQAITMYRKASILASKEMGKKKSEIDAKALNNMFEGSLLGEIEMAEAAKNLDLRESAYNHYLKMHPKGPKALEVRYQRAHVYNDKKRYRDAANEFKAVALTNDKRYKTMREKSADLSLDALVLLKDDETLEVWALELANHFPSRRMEYLKIARRSALNQVAKIINNPKSSSRDFRRAYKKMGTINLTGAPRDEQILYWKNKILLGQKLEDLDAVYKSAQGLLGVKGLPARDREYALARQVWVAEMKLDFATAYAISRKMSLPELKEDERLLRLGTLAELAGKSPNRYYNEYIKVTRSRAQANVIRAKMVERSRYPWATLKHNLDQLDDTPQILAPLALETFAKYKNYESANEVLSRRSVLGTPEGKTLYRFAFIRDFKAKDRLLSRHRLRAQSEALMAKTLETRLKRLGDMDQLANQAMQSGDWTLQLITLQSVARENKRLYDELLAAPAPRRLNKKERQQYRQLIVQQVQPYLAKAQKVYKTVEQFWENRKALEALSDDYESARGELRKLLGEELELLRQFAPKRRARELARVLSREERTPTKRDVWNARQELRESPFSVSRAKDLRELEEKTGNVAMVAFLDARIAQLQGGKK